MTLQGKDKLVLRGYILGIYFLGKTTTWYLSEEEKAPSKTPLPVPPSLSPANNLKEL